MSHVDELDLRLDSELVEQGLAITVKLDDGLAARHGELEELLGLDGRLRVVHDDTIEIRRVHVPNGSGDEVGFLIEFGRRLQFLDATGDRLPQTREIVQIALEVAFGTTKPGRSQDESDARGKVQLLEQITHGAALGVVLDLA